MNDHRDASCRKAFLENGANVLPPRRGKTRTKGRRVHRCTGCQRTFRDLCEAT
jgi:hypothetical protein